MANEIKHFFELGTPARISGFRKCFSEEIVNEFVKFRNYRDCFISVYAFREFDDQKQCPIYTSAIFDRIFFEFENQEKKYLSQEVVDEVLYFIDKIKDIYSDIKSIKIFFSGGKSLHLLLLFNEIKIFNNYTIREFMDYIEKMFNLKYLCKGARKGFTQLRRIPYTFHSRTQLWCIPLTVDDLERGASHICQKAQKGDF